MSITSPFCVLSQHVEYQIKAKSHRQGYNLTLLLVVLDLKLVFTGEAKLFLIGFICTTLILILLHVYRDSSRPMTSGLRNMARSSGK